MKLAAGDFTKRKPVMKLRIDVKGLGTGTHIRAETTTPIRDSILGGTQKKPFTVTVTDTSATPKRRGTPLPTPASGRIASSFECTEFWRYFQNASQLAFVVPGGGDAVIGRTEARQLLANFRGTNVESISKTDSGLMHICGLSVRQLHTFVSGLWRVGCVGMSVIKDLVIGSTKGPAKKRLLQSQKKRMDEHIRSHSASTHSLSILSFGTHSAQSSLTHSMSLSMHSAKHETVDDILELGTDGATRELSMFGATPIGHMEELSSLSFSLFGDMDSNYEDDVKLDRPSLRVMKSSELAKEVRKSRRLLCVDSFQSSSFGGGSGKGFLHKSMTSISGSIASWALEADQLSLGSEQLDDDGAVELLDTGDCIYLTDAELDDSSTDDGRQSTDAMLSLKCLDSHFGMDSDEIKFMDETILSPGKFSLSLSVSLSDRLATLMHAPVGV